MARWAPIFSTKKKNAREAYTQYDLIQHRENPQPRGYFTRGFSIYTSGMRLHIYPRNIYIYILLDMCPSGVETTVMCYINTLMETTTMTFYIYIYVVQRRLSHQASICLTLSLASLLPWCCFIRSWCFHLFPSFFSPSSLWTNDPYFTINVSLSPLQI